MSEFKRENVEKLLAYLTNLKETGHEEKFDMTSWLSDLRGRRLSDPREVTDWHCGTAGCFAGSWYILLKQRDEVVYRDLQLQFAVDFDLSADEDYYVTAGRWSPNGINATLDEAIAYLTLSLTRGSLLPKD